MRLNVQCDDVFSCCFLLSDIIWSITHYLHCKYLKAKGLSGLLIAMVETRFHRQEADFPPETPALFCVGWMGRIRKNPSPSRALLSVIEQRQRQGIEGSRPNSPKALRDPDRILP